MMNRLRYAFVLLACAASALAGCTADPELDPLTNGSLGEGETWVTLNFNDDSFDEINITTRATLDNIAESRVSNLFVFIFAPVGEKGEVQRVYGRYFDYTNRVDSKYELWDSKDECWWVMGNATEDEPKGMVRIKAPAIRNGTLYLLANVNSDMVNISPDKLRFVQTLDDLLNMTATLNQDITERNGFFPMTGKAEGVTITSNLDPSKVITATGDETGQYKFPILLTRLDSKVEVKVRVAEGYSGTSTNIITDGETGSGETSTITVTTAHNIKAFVPHTWQVVNLPRTAFVLPRENEDASGEFFNTREVKFETRTPGVPVTYKQGEETKTVNTDEHGFSFYMLENRPKRKKPITKDENYPNKPLYHYRDTRLTNPGDGSYTEPTDANKRDIWKYAPAEGTYLVIKGEIVMDLKISNEGLDQQLSADVEYYIHLGDFASDVDNYKICRNTSYTYTITIYGVDNIQIEVEQDKEYESGATGHVYVAKEQIFTFDSHFGRAVVSFDESHITDIDNLTWYVKTPFGREGRPHIIGGIEVPAGLDYQWVEFAINKIKPDDKYSQKTELYDPDKVMNILELSKYIKEQKAKFVADKKKDGKIDNESDFRIEYDEDWYKKFGETTNGDKDDRTKPWWRYRIYLTIFVDEFYYDANPLTGDVRTDLWKDFVNKPNRLMHILCDAEKSKDEASRTTGSVVTIRQQSIQTVYNTEKPELQTAWGCETVDETNELWYFSKEEGYDDKGYLHIPSAAVTGYQGNESDGNGLFNTARIWGLVKWDPNIRHSVFAPMRWEDYVDYDQNYDLVDKETINTLRYSCLTRNRDEDGDGLIDAQEVKWYLAAISQLSTLYIGDQGLSSDAVLYPYENQKYTGKEMDENHIYPWRVHVVSSTAHNKGSYPKILWAEEGLSVGQYDLSYGKSAGFSVRCVRNLGMDPPTESEAVKRLEEDNHEIYMPEKAINVTGPKLGGNNESPTANSVYRFDLTNLNPLSIRYFTSKELEPNNEHSVEARPYWAFETGIMTDKVYTYDELAKLIRDGWSPCPDGYRVPNVREGALIALRCPSEWPGSESRVSTWYSHGELGTKQDIGADGIATKISKSWLFNSSRTYLDNGDNGRIRCVRDIRQ